VDGYLPSDLATYASRFGLPPFADPLPHLGPLNLKPAGESNLDLEAAHGLAPDAKLVYVNLSSFGGKNASPVAQFQQAFSAVNARYPGAIWSVSLGQCEDIFSSSDLTAANDAVKLAGQHGTSAFVASGDSGNGDPITYEVVISCAVRDNYAICAYATGPQVNLNSVLNHPTESKLALTLWANPDVNGVRWKGESLP
jgi:subtilase family serine protease